MRSLKKIIVWLIFLIFLGILAYALREPVFRAAGNYLIAEDQLEKVDAIFVLGGGSYNRGNEAARLFHEQYAPKIICVGANVPTIFQAMEVSFTESQIAQKNLVRNGVPAKATEVLFRGTSTREEAEAITDYCIQHQLKKIMVLSDKFHTRRIRMVLAPLFEKSNIEWVLTGAPSSVYREEEWWKSEEGLIMVNNEYMKLGYYRLKY